MKEFQDLKYSQIRIFLKIANNLKEKNLEYIEKKHKNFSENTEGVVFFLKNLKILYFKNNKLYIKQNFQTSKQEYIPDIYLKERLINELINSSHPLSKTINSYLANYKPYHNNFVYKPITASRVKESNLRNFLIELNLIECIPNEVTYRINEKYFHLFETFLNNNRISPKELKTILKRKNNLGKAAEVKILEYEKNRLKKHPHLLKKIKYVAQIDVLAGYDILSWDIINDKNIKPRYIEVKATSGEKKNFYWSRNEIVKAESLADRYYLYLLPVKNYNQFDLNKIEIIKNPIKTLLNDSKRWNKEVESYLFSKINKE